MKAARRIDRARRRAEGQLDRLEALRRHARLTPEAFFQAAPAIREYLAAVEAERARSHQPPARPEELGRIFARTRALAEALGLAEVWDETMGSGPRRI